MKNKVQNLLFMIVLIILVACGSSNVGNRSMKPVLRAATDVPERFEAPAGYSFNNSSCLSPLTDPRDGTEIIMQSSFKDEGVGDYVVPSGFYGVGDRELLRINCRTGEVLGIVRR